MKRKTETLLISGIITFFLVFLLFIIGEGGITSLTPIYFIYSSPYYTSFTLSTTGPSYFFPFADVSISLTSPYAKLIENFTVYDSLDNSTWVLVPISDTSAYTKIGTVPLNGFGVTIYQKVIFQTQDVKIQNQTVPFSEVVASFVEGGILNPLPTPQTWVIFILLGIAVFSFTLQIIDFWTKRDSESPD